MITAIKSTINLYPDRFQSLSSPMINFKKFILCPFQIPLISLFKINRH